jgi:hypothetical protein
MSSLILVVDDESDVEMLFASSSDANFAPAASRWILPGQVKARFSTSMILVAPPWS